MLVRVALPLSRTIILSNSQRNVFQCTSSNISTALCTKVNSSLKKCLSLHAIVKHVGPTTQMHQVFKGAGNPMFKQCLCTSATEGQNLTEEKAPGPKKTEISHDELLEFVKSGGKYIFDVRDPAEVEETGMIPSAINIPLTKLKSSMMMSDAEYQELYKAKKPTPDESAMMVFYGLSSVKSSAALEIIHKMGYKKARQYPGGYEEWRVKSGVEAGNKK